MSKRPTISLGRQIQLAVCVFVLLPATLSYGPASGWFEKLDLALRKLTTPSVQVAEYHKPLLVAVEPEDAGDQALIGRVVAKLNSARSVTLIDPVVGAQQPLVETIRYHGAVYVTDAANADGQRSDAAIRAAARGTGHSALPITSREQHRGLQTWRLTGNAMRSSAALQPLLNDEQWQRSATEFYQYPDARVVRKDIGPLEPIAARALLEKPDRELAADVSIQHVFVGKIGATGSSDNGFVDPTLIRFGKMHTALASGEVLLQPRWALTISWLIIAIGMFTMVSQMWRESRRVIVLGTVTLCAFLIVLQWFLARQFSIQVDVFRPMLALVSGAAICFWLTPDRKSNRRESFRSGLRYLRAGRLDAAFRVLKSCPPHPSLMPSLYKLAIAFEKRNQPEQARAVFAYMGRNEDGTESSPTKVAPRREGIPDEIPEKLGRYEVLRPLGQGAMGGVFLGRDPRINRLIALKIVSFRHYEDEALMVEMRGRFFREAESVGRLTHPCITAVYDSGEEQGLGYIAMEYVPGVQMTEFLRRDNLLDPVVVLQLGVRVAEALDYAHGEHVVHRDIKPANLLYDAQTDSIKITDFGVAKLVDAERTQTGIILGTPSYMSPEQARGDNVTGISDLFSLGVTLYELLTGDVP
ncbi:MAG: serine/threonine-protein kinase, partial [Pseudomonadota bacterium]